MNNLMTELNKTVDLNTKLINDIKSQMSRIGQNKLGFDWQMEKLISFDGRVLTRIEWVKYLENRMGDLTEKQIKWYMCCLKKV
jgi:hypothetical protein